MERRWASGWLFSALFVAPLCVAGFSCAGEEAPSARERLIRHVLRLAFAQEIQAGRLQCFQTQGKDLELGQTTGETQDIVVRSTEPTQRRTATLRLALVPFTPQLREFLTGLLADKDSLVAYNAARALAYHADRSGLELLWEIARGDRALTQSEFEREGAVWALLALGEEPPKPTKPHHALPLDPDIVRLLQEPKKE